MTTAFEIESFHNMHLPRGGTMVDVVVTVTAGGQGHVSSHSQERSEILIVDTSGSMAAGEKIRSARAATVAAIDCIPDGVRFGLIAGNARARLAYPSSLPLVPASEESRREARQAVANLGAKGGTAIGEWIELAAESFAGAPGISHAILLTDGKNESESDQALEASLERAKGVFQCDCRGVGADWNVAELRKVASALTGSVDIIESPDDMVESFSSMMRDALDKDVGDVRLRVWTPHGASVAALKQMDPEVDLVANRVEVDARSGEYALGAWGRESRDFFLRVRVQPHEIDTEVMAARVTLVVDGVDVGRCLVPAAWTDDVAKSTQMHPRVAQVRDEEELASELQGIVNSFRNGDIDSATARAGRAARMAHEAGNDDVLERISRLVEIDDPATGRVRPKAKVEDLDVMVLETKSTRTTVTRPPMPKEGGGS